MYSVQNNMQRLVDLMSIYISHIIQNALQKAVWEMLPLCMP